MHSRPKSAKRGVKALAPDSKSYINTLESSVPTDELFIYKFVREKAAKKALEKDDDDEDAESVTDEDFDLFLDKLSGSKKNKDLDFSKGLQDVKDEDLESDVDDTESDDDYAEGNIHDAESDIDDAEDDENFKDLDSGDEFGEEDFGSSNDDDDEADVAKAPSRKRPLDSTKTKAKMKLRKTMKGGGGLNSLLASAEEFAEAVDEAAVDDLDLGGFGAVSNVKDGAKKKQLLWEEKRTKKTQSWKKQKNFKRKGKK